jgi:hypothetical protein
MTPEVWAAVGGVVGIVALILKAWFSGAAAIEEKKDEKEKQALRQAVVDGDADVVMSKLDQLLEKAERRRAQSGKDPKG